MKKIVIYVDFGKHETDDPKHTIEYFSAAFLSGFRGIIMNRVEIYDEKGIQQASLDITKEMKERVNKLNPFSLGRIMSSNPKATFTNSEQPIEENKKMYCKFHHYQSVVVAEHQVIILECGCAYRYGDAYGLTYINSNHDP